MPITPPPTGNSRLLGRCGVLIAGFYNACHYSATVRVNPVAEGCSNTFPSGCSTLWGPEAMARVLSSRLYLPGSDGTHHILPEIEQPLLKKKECWVIMELRGCLTPLPPL